MHQMVYFRRARNHIGPADHGRRMAFGRFQRAATDPGFCYELAAGVIEVTDVPGRIHALMLHEIEKQLFAYQLAHPKIIAHMAGGGFAKTEMPALQSERHPDYSIYLTPMPDDEYPWDKWVPTIVIEVVSPGRDAATRDYKTKRREYLAAGILEYWIFDPQKATLLALSRHGDTWRERRLKAPAKWESRLLPGFSLQLKPIFAVLDRPGAK